jgi:hypothetical protein
MSIPISCRSGVAVLGSILLFAVVAACLAFAGSAAAEPSEHPFEIVPGSFKFTTSSTQAAAHADWITSFEFSHEASGRTDNDVRNIVVNFPAGFVGNSTAVPTCTQAELLARTGEEGEVPECPLASQVGQISLVLTVGANGTHRYVFPIYNMEIPGNGVAVELGFRAVFFTTLLRVEVRPGDTGLSVTTPNITRTGEPHGIVVTTWALPASSEHDAQRGETCIETACHNEFGGPQEAHIPVRPFLSNPTSCGPFTATMEAYSWEDPGSVSMASAETPPITECERVPFEPSLEVQPTIHSAESPTGLNVSLLVPQTYENPYSIASANLKDTTVTLPQGVTINPSAGSGLAACTVAQYQSETSSSLPGEGCPPESKIGSIEIETPLLEEEIPGAVYVATPYQNVPEFGSPEHPGGSLLALYVVAKDPVRGIVIRTAGKIALNPVTGQLTTTFMNTPQQPFSRFTLKFRPGATAPLVSPPACGTYVTQGELTPWSAPLQPRLLSSAQFETTEGVHEGPCPAGGVPPFKPQVISGTQNNAGGSYSPFYLRIVREDGEQELTKFTTILPPGLTGNLTGIPFCSEAQIEQARQVTGEQEIVNPSCPAVSEIGHTLVEAGVGTTLAQTPGKVYLAGPYHGAPLSIVSITSAKVGPFDLGTVVIRFALDINPVTAQVEVSGAQSDPIPHILDGVVVHVRDIRVYMDRPGFTLNPTNCSPLEITDAITGAGADPANPADQETVNVQSSFEAADCAGLGFKPVFKAATSSKATRANGTSLRVALSYPKAPQGTQSNIKSVKVDLPKQLPSRLTTLQKACTSKVFDANPSACPADSRVGMAKALTPILPVPLEGPAYFVSYGDLKFPELIVVLQGYGFTIYLHGETFISKKGITSSTFRTIPDQPVTSFELTLPAGPDSALAANGNLCKVKGGLKMPTAFVAQNGLTLHQSTPIAVSGCAKAKAKAKKPHKAQHSGKRVRGKQR